MNEERDEMIKNIVLRPCQPTLEDAVSLMKFENRKEVDVLFDLYNMLRSKWVDRKLG